MIQSVINWLLNSDPAVVYQTKRDLLNLDERDLRAERNAMLRSGWVKELLALQDPEGTWRQGYYGPKFISTHYTLMLLRRFESPEDPKISKGCAELVKIESIGNTADPKQDMTRVDACITGMGLSILAFFKEQKKIKKDLFEYIKRNQLPDGGWNCRLGRYPNKKVKHSSMHTTLLVLEGLRELALNYPSYQLKVHDLIQPAHEFLLIHELYKSHRTKKIIHQDFIEISFPPRWKYNILTALDYFQSVEVPYDSRMQDALRIIQNKGRDGFYYQGKQMSGKKFFPLGKPRAYSAFNTLRAQRVLKAYQSQFDEGGR
ncbi:MAG: hypothetical protein DRO88_00845 [Promethearchaeia archaeon]|nr:MAG: hypothetical protein DRO88_00845 [Candidatus Lokiarchaeia archaeon]